MSAWSTLDAGGIRGIRFNLTRPGGAGAELIAPLAARVAKLGWHVQIHMTAAGILENLDKITGLPTDLVIDHLGRIPGAAGTAHPAYPAILKLIDAGRTWVKLSGVYHEIAGGSADLRRPQRRRQGLRRLRTGAASVGIGLAAPTASRGEVPMPDDAAMLDLFASWVPRTRDQHRIMVQNSARLYFRDC